MGDFELQPCTDSLNGEQLHVVHRCESQGAVLVVHDYHAVERVRHSKLAVEFHAYAAY